MGGSAVSFGTGVEATSLPGSTGSRQAVFSEAEAESIAMQDLMFTLLVTCASRGLILRDRLMGRPGRTVDVEAPRASAIHYWIPSGGNFLDALLMEPVGRPAKASVLICHGIGETVEHWRAAQRLLAEHGVCSLVFNYSGYGRSLGRVNAEQWERDAIEAFCFLQRMRPAGGVSVLGYSLGSGVAAAMVNRVPARRLFVCAGFLSLRKAARRAGLPEWMARMLLDIWNNEDALRHVEVPVVIVHGAEDRLFPPWMAEDLAAACEAPCELAVVPGVSHNAPIFAPAMSFWGEVVRRL